MKIPLAAAPAPAPKQELHFTYIDFLSEYNTIGFEGRYELK